MMNIRILGFVEWDKEKHPQSSIFPEIDPYRIAAINMINKEERTEADRNIDNPTINKIPNINSIHGRIIPV